MMALVHGFSEMTAVLADLRLGRLFALIRRRPPNPGCAPGQALEVQYLYIDGAHLQRFGIERRGACFIALLSLEWFHLTVLMVLTNGQMFAGDSVSCDCGNIKIPEDEAQPVDELHFVSDVEGRLDLCASGRHSRNCSQINFLSL